MRALLFLRLQPLAWAALLTAGAAQAHGLGIMEDPATTVVVRVAYADGESAPYAEVKVFGPGPTASEFQNGRADALGRFAFAPNAEGEWAVQAADGMGHAARRVFSIRPPASIPTGAAPNQPKAAAPQSGWLLAALGASLLLNFFCLAGLLRDARRSP